MFKSGISERFAVHLEVHSKLGGSVLSESGPATAGSLQFEVS